MVLRRQSQQSSGGKSPNTQALFNLTQGKKYDADKVYSASTDGRGHYEQVRVKITPGIDHLISEVAANHDEFRSREDFIRNAVFHALHRWITDAPEPDPRLLSALKAEQARAHMDMMERFAKAHEEALETAAEAINRCLDSRDWDEMVELAEMLDDYSTDENIPSGYRVRYESAADDARAALAKELKARKRRK